MYVPKNVRLNFPVELIIEVKGKHIALMPRNLIILEKGAGAEIILRADIQSDSNVLINGVSEIVVAENAELTFEHFEFENRNCFQIWTHELRMARDSRAHIHTLSSSSDWIRNNLNIAITGPNAEANLNGAYQIAGTEHVDNHTCVDHIAPDCQSNELYKGMVDGKGTGVFNGKVFVRQDAQRTNAYQSNANLVLSDDAVMNSKPELEIYADDVKCSHGSTTGQFDEDAVFYLRARGIAEMDARKLLVKAFVGEVIEKLKNESLRNYAYDKMGLSEIAGNIIME
jgi:Fe-S cluster assembly protein SufD